MSTGDQTQQAGSQTTEHVGHSRGEWAAFYKDKYKEWHVGVPVNSGGMKIALFPDGCPTENPEADCRLIAAAPDMLAALKAAQRDLEAVEREMQGIAPEAVSPVLPLIRAAIAKAEGRTS
jgi:hypothetical protein